MGSSSLHSAASLTFGGGGGGGGRIDVVVGDDVEEDTIAPEGIRNSVASVLKMIVEVCIVISWLQFFSGRKKLFAYLTGHPK